MNTRLFLLFILLPCAVACGAPATTGQGPNGESTAVPAVTAGHTTTLPAPTAGVTPTSAPSATPTTVPEVDFDWLFTAETALIDLQITADEARAVTAVIPLTGGQLTATAADGTHYSLDIPDDALLEETEMTLTPLTAVAGLPGAPGPTLAVHLAPEGLRLQNFATLTIVPATSIPVTQQLFFGFHADGQQLFLAPPAAGDALQIKILHFSGYGVGQGFLSDYEPLRQRLGGDAEARLTSLVGEILQRERQHQLLGDEPSAIDLTPYFQAFNDLVVQPRLAAAGESCAHGRLAIDTALSFQRQLQLLGIGDDNAFSATAQLGDLLTTVGRKCLQEEYEMCRDQHVVHRIVTAWLTIERQMQLLGIDGAGANTSPLYEEGRRLVERCLHFELEFESTADFKEGKDGYESYVRALVPVNFQEGFTLKGSSALINVFFEFRITGCQVTSNRGGSTLEVLDLDFVIPPFSLTEEMGFVQSLKLAYRPSNTTESYSVTCDGTSFTPPPVPYWSAAYLVLHRSELDPSRGVFTVDDWTLHGGERFAEREWNTIDQSLGLTEFGFMTLYHRPK